jgi:hypothetical protein
MILLFLGLKGPFLILPRVEDHNELHSTPSACISAESNRLHGNRSNPEEMNMSNAMKGEPGLATRLTPVGVLLPFLCLNDSLVGKTCQAARVDPDPRPHPLPTALRNHPLTRIPSGESIWGSRSKKDRLLKNQ